MDKTQRRITYWTVAALITATLIAPFAAAHLAGMIILLPVLPATPAIISGWLQLRVNRQDLRDLNSRPEWLP